MARMHKKTLRWCAQLLLDAADECDLYSNPHPNWASTTIATPAECMARACILRGLAREMLAARALGRGEG